MSGKSEIFALSGAAKGRRNDMPKVVLRSTLGYLEREAKRRAEGGAARAVRLHDDELLALVEVLQREVGAGAEVVRDV